MQVDMPRVNDGNVQTVVVTLPYALNRDTTLGQLDRLGEQITEVLKGAGLTVVELPAVTAKVLTTVIELSIRCLLEDAPELKQKIQSIFTTSSNIGAALEHLGVPA